MGGRIRPESVEALERNDWKDYPGIRSLDCIDGFPKRNKINFIKGPVEKQGLLFLRLKGNNRNRYEA